MNYAPWLIWPISGIVLHLALCYRMGVFKSGVGWTISAMLMCFPAAIAGPTYLIHWIMALEEKP